MWALSVGFPGREKSISTPFRCAHWSSIRPANSGPLLTLPPALSPQPELETVEGRRMKSDREVHAGADHCVLKEHHSGGRAGLSASTDQRCDVSTLGGRSTGAGGVRCPQAEGPRGGERALKKLCGIHARCLVRCGRCRQKTSDARLARKSVTWAIEEKDLLAAARRQLVGLPPKAYRYVSRARTRRRVAFRLRALANERRRFGYRCPAYPLAREGHRLNHKNSVPAVSAERLGVRRRGGRKRALGTRVPMALPQGMNQRWSLDFRLTRGLLGGGFARAGGGRRLHPRVSGRWWRIPRCRGCASGVNSTDRGAAWPPGADRQRQWHRADLCTRCCAGSRNVAWPGTTSRRAKPQQNGSSKASTAGSATSA